MDQIMDFLEANEVEYLGVPGSLTRDGNGIANEEIGFKLRHETHADALLSKSKLIGKQITAVIKNQATQEERTYVHEIEIELCIDQEDMNEEIE